MTRWSRSGPCPLVGPCIAGLATAAGGLTARTPAAAHELRHAVPLHPRRQRQPPGAAHLRLLRRPRLLLRPLRRGDRHHRQRRPGQLPGPAGPRRRLEGLPRLWLTRSGRGGQAA
ncbi:MAG: hypothetical protein AVDCRST_MAG41-4397 [uncultured Corynebacteriales bacterium]|uniref:Uncharacterized protein n=1 Tax=uncultured Mycobacteriales bacterium TaxID=581187 RepID=A0A6J4JZJ7_9ACTN|nr:MAG: hypothetical protein AVDCRST_MAG41-4397 [uncultured Corynebacteriales bacterium]